MPSKKSADKQLLDKIERYCAFQERCRQDVTIKLRQLGADDSQHEQIIVQLIKENFINEARYAKAFAADRFRLNGWGKFKINLALQAKGISAGLIERGLAEIGQREYEQKLKSMLKKKAAELSDVKDSFIRNNKLAAFLTSRGFEPELVWTMIENEVERL